MNNKYLKWFIRDFFTAFGFTMVIILFGVQVGLLK